MPAGALSGYGRIRLRASVLLMPPLVNLSSLIDDAKCYELVRQHRWPEGVRCPACDSAAVTRHGRDDTEPHRQRYRCQPAAAASTT